MRTNFKSALSIVLCFIFLCLPITVVMADDSQPPIMTTVTGKDGRSYKIQIDDDADLFSENEEQLLLENMQKVAEMGGNVLLITTKSNPKGSAEAYARSEYSDFCKQACGMVFIIDLYTRRLQLVAYEEFFDKITNKKADQIADNVYRYASNEKYFECSQKVFDQAYIVLNNRFLFSPMKLVTSIFLAFCISLLVFIIIVQIQRKKNHKLAIIDITSGNGLFPDVNVVTQKILIDSVKTRHVENRSSGHSGGGHSSGGHSGGGGGHSGGGGHGF